MAHLQVRVWVLDDHHWDMREFSTLDEANDFASTEGASYQTLVMQGLSRWDVGKPVFVSRFDSGATPE